LHDDLQPLGEDAGDYDIAVEYQHHGNGKEVNHPSPPCYQQVHHKSYLHHVQYFENKFCHFAS
jgi:hypothetical protein